MRNIVLFATLVFFASCSNYRAYDGYYNYSNYGYDNLDQASTDNFNSGAYLDQKDGEGPEYKTPASEQMLVYNAYLFMAVDVPDSASQDVVSISKKYGGYAQTIGTNEAVIRVPSESLNSAIADIELLGKLKNKMIRADDMTMYYKDNKIRLENAEKARARYLELLNKAATVQEMVQVGKGT
ncbi:MAG: DUF4349 domain-containing protein [Bacteroidota bacterium]|nr:DUF4349 domain-containing protein [Bacteroidota bacterium]